MNTLCKHYPGLPAVQQRGESVHGQAKLPWDPFPAPAAWEQLEPHGQRARSSSSAQDRDSTDRAAQVTYTALTTGQLCSGRNTSRDVPSSYPVRPPTLC